MAIGRKQGCDRLSWVIVLGLAGALNASANVQAQVVPDASLPVNSVVTVNGNNFTINGGTQAGRNLFHSFSEFSIPTNASAFFNNAQTIENIISRVTGSSVSNIDGMLGANGTRTNLFLLNPNGIVFGPNASLNVGGSFIGTTANAIQFGNQGFFSASNPNNPALLTINPSALFFNQIAAASNPNISTTATNLSVGDGQGLFLVGGNINIDGGRLNAFGGRVELGGLAEVGTVALNLSGNDSSLSFPNAVRRGDVSLTNGAVVDVSGGNGGNIAINAAKVMVSGGANIVAHTFGQGNAGSIAITASDDISISGNNTALGSQVFPLAIGNGGTISLNAPIVRISDNAAFIADSQGRGNGGNIAINAAKVTVSNGANLAANTFGQGNAGSIAIAASDDISINGNQTTLGSSQSLNDATGNGGTITLNAPKVMVSGGANIVAHTFGQGNAGIIAITASDDISISGNNTALGSQVFPLAIGNGGTISLNAPIVRISDNAAFIADSQGRGNGGNIAINAAKVTVSNGANLAANTFGQGNAGSIAIAARDDISIDGRNTALGSQVFGNATGNGGTINLNAPKVTVSDGAALIANTSGQGNAGTIRIDAANSLLIDGRSTALGTQALGNATGNGGTINLKAPKVTVSGGADIVANTEAQGNAGTITIDAANSLLIDGEGTGVGTQVLGDATGNGGTINLNAPRVTVSGGADIVANTEAQGNAGTITIDAKQVFLDGEASDKQPHGIGSAVFGSASGNGGQIVINTGLLNLTNNAQLIVSSIGQGTAGEIKIDSRSIRLNNQSNIRATTAFGNGGNITLTARDLLLLRRGSQISTTAGNDRAGGDGGNITINTPFLIAVPNENSDISANAFSGRGGKVNITATGVYGIESRPQPTLLSDITASSQLGVAGVVLINTPDVDPSRGLINLPALVVNSPQLLASECNAFIGKEGSSFTVTGRGGLPSSPDDFLSSDVVWSDTRLAAMTTQRQDLNTTTAKFVPRPPVAIVPATGWVFNGKGEVTLISNVSSTTERFRSSSDTCLRR